MSDYCVAIRRLTILDEESLRGDVIVNLGHTVISPYQKKKDDPRIKATVTVLFSDRQMLNLYFFICICCHARSRLYSLGIECCTLFLCLDLHSLTHDVPVFGPGESFYAKDRHHVRRKKERQRNPQHRW